MKKYISPEMTEIKAEAKDIITVSTYQADIDGGNAKFLDSWKDDNATW